MDPGTICVEAGKLADLAIECWRLGRWLRGAERDKTRLPVRHVARKLERFLAECGIEIEDPEGEPYADGLAVEIVEVVDDERTASPSVAETLRPIVLWRGRVVREGQVVLRRKPQARADAERGD